MIIAGPGRTVKEKGDEIMIAGRGRGDRVRVNHGSIMND
jgi:hypothetical protein